MWLYLVLGTVFGVLLSRSGAADYDFVQAMFLFKSVQLYGIIGTAVVLTAPGLWLLKRFGRTATGVPLQIPLKPRTRGNVVGGLLFGVGWSMAGLAGALCGAALLGVLYDVLQRPLRLPAAGANAGGEI